jgi:hypothetical protein
MKGSAPQGWRRTGGTPGLATVREFFCGEMGKYREWAFVCFNGVSSPEFSPVQITCPRYFERVKLLFIGDIVGQPGRRAVKELLPKLRERHALDFVVANGENSAGGSGITAKTAEEIFAAGVDVITSGDHLWDQKEVVELLANEKRFLRPLNYPPTTPGFGSGIFEIRNTQHAARIGVLNLQGRSG